MKRKRQLNSSRPYRLHAGLAGTKHHGEIRYRYYSTPIRAHEHALIEAKYAKIGEVISVWNKNAGRLLGEYLRHKSGIEFRGAHHGRKLERSATSKVQGNDEKKAEQLAEWVVDSLV